MDLRSLQENRRHGSPDFPVGIYRMERKAGEPILETHWHEESEFLAVEHGKAVFQIGLSAYEAQAGELLFIPGGELHGGYPLDESPCTYSAVVFDLDWLMSGQDRLTTQWLRPIRRGEIALPMHAPHDQPWGRNAYRIMAALTGAARSADPAAAFRIKGGLYGLFAEFVSSGLAFRREPWEASHSGTPERLKRVLTHIEENYGRKITVGELAGIAGMSEGHFSRLFKSYMRKTPIEYINGLRLRRAAALLREPGVSVSKAAMECGFENFSYFSKMFRAMYRCTPTEYRK